MRDRALIHKTKVGEFKHWLRQEHWELLPTKGAFEVIRAKKGERLIIYHERMQSDHITSWGDGLTIAKHFINFRRNVRGKRTDVLGRTGSSRINSRSRTVDHGDSSPADSTDG